MVNPMKFSSLAVLHSITPFYYLFPETQASKYSTDEEQHSKETIQVSLKRQAKRHIWKSNMLLNRRAICPTEKHPKRKSAVCKELTCWSPSQNTPSRANSLMNLSCCMLKTGYETGYDFQQILTGLATLLCSR